MAASCELQTASLWRARDIIGAGLLVKLEMVDLIKRTNVNRSYVYRLAACSLKLAAKAAAISFSR